MPNSIFHLCKYPKKLECLHLYLKEVFLKFFSLEQTFMAEFTNILTHISKLLSKRSGIRVELTAHVRENQGSIPHVKPRTFSHITVGCRGITSEVARRRGLLSWHD